MSCFVDTSAFIALLDADDECHGKARVVWTRLLDSSVNLVTTNYVLLETFAVIQSRFGLPAVRRFQEDVRPVLSVEWVSESRHAAAVSSLLSVSRKKLSLVDCCSFDVMRRLGIKKAFAFDRHFSEQGFTKP